jgi:hypothetical protein
LNHIPYLLVLLMDSLEKLCDCSWHTPKKDDVYQRSDCSSFFYETSIGNDVLNTESLISVTYLAVMLVLIATGGFIVLVSQVFFGSLNTLLNTQKIIIKSDELPKL